MYDVAPTAASSGFRASTGKSIPAQSIYDHPFHTAPQTSFEASSRVSFFEEDPLMEPDLENAPENFDEDFVLSRKRLFLDNSPLVSPLVP